MPSGRGADLDLQARGQDDVFNELQRPEPVHGECGSFEHESAVTSTTRLR
jgi:hypothetical protein